MSYFNYTVQRDSDIVMTVEDPNFLNVLKVGETYEMSISNFPEGTGKWTVKKIEGCEVTLERSKVVTVSKWSPGIKSMTYK